MKPNKNYKVIKDIPLEGGKSIPKGTEINRTHGFYYMNGVLLSYDYQQDFDMLIDKEEREGWEYFTAIVDKIAFKNTKEDI